MMYDKLETLYNEVVAELTKKVVANGGKIELFNSPISVVNVEDYEVPLEVVALMVENGDLKLGCAFEFEDNNEDEESYVSAMSFLSFHIEDLLNINEHID